MSTSSHIFISYKTEQRPLAFQVRDKLQEWGYETWLDVDKLQPGTYWANDIDQALKTCLACIGVMTPMSIKSRYVTNEWDMAIMKGKLFLPLMFEHTDPHYKYIDIQYVDFTSDPKEDSYSQLKSRLQNHKPSSSDKPPDDPYHDYLQQLYDRINKYLSAKLVTSLTDDEGRPEPIRLSSARVDGAVDALFEKHEEIDPLFTIGGISDEPPQNFDNFSKAADYFEYRVLLLGEPGSGKTITLLHHARDAIVKRYQDGSAPLPIIGLIPTWDADKQLPLNTWLTTQYGVPTDIETLTRHGETLLLLDGLDELGSERPVDPNRPDGEKYDPRSRFLQMLPTNNQIILTCRTKDYQEIADQAPLKGALELKELNDSQIETYLRFQPELLAFIESDVSLKRWLDTPLLLSYFAVVYQSTSIDERKDFANLKSASELRDRILSHYIIQRYEDEKRKHSLELDFGIEKLYQLLGRISVRNIAEWQRTPNVFTEHDIEVETLYNTRELIPFLVTMNLLTFTINNQVSFVHMFLRDYFAYHFAISNLTDRTWGIMSTRSLAHIRDRRAIPHLIEAFPRSNSYLRSSIARVLGDLQSTESVEVLVKGLSDNDYSVTRSISMALSRIGSMAIPTLAVKLHDSNSDVQNEAAYALGQLKAFDILVEALSSENPNIRGASAYGLSSARDESVLNVLLELADHSDIRVRHNAVSGLKQLAAPRSIDKLATLLNDTGVYSSPNRYRVAPSRWIVMKRICDIAAEALEAINTPEALNILAQWKRGKSGESE